MKNELAVNETLTLMQIYPNLNKNDINPPISPK